MASRNMLLTMGGGGEATNRSFEVTTLEILRKRMMEHTQRMQDLLEKQRDGEWTKEEDRKEYERLYSRLEMYRGAKLRDEGGSIIENPSKLMQYALVEHTELSSRLHMGMLGEVTASRLA
jgi:hypothetical protein